MPLGRHGRQAPGNDTPLPHLLCFLMVTPQGRAHLRAVSDTAHTYESIRHNKYYNLAPGTRTRASQDAGQGHGRKRPGGIKQSRSLNSNEATCHTICPCIFSEIRYIVVGATWQTLQLVPVTCVAQA